MSHMARVCRAMAAGNCPKLIGSVEPKQSSLGSMFCRTRISGDSLPRVHLLYSARPNMSPSYSRIVSFQRVRSIKAR